MDKIDKNLEQRVWQRVQGQEPAGPAGLQVLAAAELEAAGIFLMLSRQVQGREKAVLRRLFEEEQRHADCLRGMHILATGQRMAIRIPPVQPQTPEAALRKCYGKKLQVLTEYARKAEDREYGPAFASLARQEQEHCVLILELIGALSK